MARLMKLVSLLTTGALYCAGETHAAQAPSGPGYPTRTVRMVVPFAPGGSDIVARMLTPKLSEKLGQTFVIDNRPGAGSMLGTQTVAESPPDGHTLLFCTSSLATTAVYYKKVPYDPTKDLVGVARVGWVPFVLVVHPALPVKSVKEFIALAKKRPGELFYSSAGTGGIGHLVNEYFAKQVGIKVTHVAYKGTGPSVTALLSGEVQFGMPNISGALGIVRANKVRSLGIAAPQRLAFAPELPTLRELGVDLVEGPWYGIVAPRGTPQAAIELLHREVTALVKTSDMTEKLGDRGVVVETAAPQEFSDFIRADIQKWRGVMVAAGVPQE